MRVTKIIRDYVEKTVSAMPKFKDKTPEELAYIEMQSKIMAFKEGIDDEVKHFVNEAITRFRTENAIPEDIEIEFHTSYCPVSSSMWGSKIKAASDDNERARNSAKVKAIQDILVTLELGGTKAELDEMLKALAEGGDA
jgi:CDP-glycerol glycerophosphotransferase (TagB/SpsB family)